MKNIALLLITGCLVLSSCIKNKESTGEGLVEVHPEVIMLKDGRKLLLIKDRNRLSIAVQSGDSIISYFECINPEYKGWCNMDGYTKSLMIEAIECKIDTLRTIVGELKN